MSELPSGWRETTLEEVADIIMGQSPKSETYNFISDGIPFYQGVTEFTDKYVKIKTYTNKPTKIVEKNTILFSVRAPVGRVNFVNHQCCIGRGNAGFLMKNGEQDFLYYLLQHIERKIQNYTSGTVFTSISGVELKKIPIVIPENIIEQKAIANILSSFDNKIELLKEQNRTLETLSQTIFKEWFVNNVEINKWSDKKLNELVTIVDNRGKTPPVAKEKTDFPLIEVNALDSNLRIINYNVIRKYVDKNTFNTWFRNKLNKYDIVMATVGTLGNFSMYLDRVGNIAQNLIGISPIDISPFYIYQLLKHRKIEILKLDIGGVQPSIKVPHLLSLNIKIPPVKLLNKYDSIMKVFTEKLLLNDQQIQTLQKTRDTLLPKLMSGKLRVKGFEDG